MKLCLLFCNQLLSQKDYEAYNFAIRKIEELTVISRSCRYFFALQITNIRMLF